MRKILALLLVLLFASPASAFMLPLLGGRASSVSDVIFWEDFTATGATPTLTDNNCNNGTDTSWAATNDATVDATAKLSGDYGLDIPSEVAPGDNADYLYLTVTSNDYVNPTKGALVFMFRVTYWASNGALFTWRDSGTNDALYIRSDAGGASDFNLVALWQPAGATERTATTSSASLDVNTTYWAVVLWDSDAETMSIQAYDTSGNLLGSAGTNSSSMTAMVVNTIRVGDLVGTDDGSFGVGEYIDKIVIFDGSIARTAAQYLAIAKENASCPR